MRLNFLIYLYKINAYVPENNGINNWLTNKPNASVPCYISKQKEKDMKRRSNTNVWLMIGAIVAIILLMIWLFVGTTLEEDANSETDPMTIEQNI